MLININAFIDFNFNEESIKTDYTESYNNVRFNYNLNVVVISSNSDEVGDLIIIKYNKNNEVIKFDDSLFANKAEFKRLIKKFISGYFDVCKDLTLDNFEFNN